jgi:hypothetical protein
LADAAASSKAETEQGNRKEIGLGVGRSTPEGSASPRSLGTALISLFSDAMHLLCAKPCPAPQPKRRRKEETWASFRMAAKKLIRRAAYLPNLAFAALATDNPLDLLNSYWAYPAVTEEQSANANSSDLIHLSLEL